MKKVPVITDLHFGSRGDSQVIYQNQEDFYMKEFWPAIDAYGQVEDILCLGDVTDRRKFINFQTLSFAKHMLFDPAKERNIRVHWVLGNHDLPFKQSLQLSSFEAFREYENLTVYQTATPVTFDGVSILLMPWLCDENREASMQALAEFDGAVVGGHFEFGGFEMFRGVVNQHGSAIDAYRHFKLVMSGHYHHKSSSQNIHYLGAPYEMIWSDYGDPHGFHWWTPQTHHLEFVENPHHLFYKFYYNDAGQPGSYVKTLLDSMHRANLTQKIVKVLVKTKTQPVWYDTFVDAAVKLGAHDIQFIDDVAMTADDMQAEEHDASLDTLTLIHKYVDSLPWANAELQHDVTTLLTNLYQEAAEHAKTLART